MKKLAVLASLAIVLFFSQSTEAGMYYQVRNSCTHFTNLIDVWLSKPSTPYNIAYIQVWKNKPADIYTYHSDKIPETAYVYVDSSSKGATVPLVQPAWAALYPPASLVFIIMDSDQGCQYSYDFSLF
jgi:hypothetical protein